MEEKRKEEEVDLIVIVEYLKQLVRSFFFLIVKVLIGLYFLIKSNVLILLGSIIVSFLLAMVSIWVKPPAYTAKIDIKTYEGMAAGVYGTIEYMNALIGNKILIEELIDNGFTQQDYKLIKAIEIYPIINSKESKTLYKNYLMEIDSSYSALMTYEEFMNSVDKSEYKKHTVIVKSSENVGFKSFFNNLIFFLNDKTNAKKIVEKENALKAEKLQLVENNIYRLDSTLAFLKETKKVNSNEGVSDVSIFLDTYLRQRSDLMDKKINLFWENNYVTVLNRYDNYGIISYKERIVKVTLWLSIFFFTIVMLFKLDYYLRNKQ